MTTKYIPALGYIIFSFMVTNTFAQSSHNNLLEGDKFYRSGEFYLAEEQYRKARESERELKSTFNLGNAVYKQERYEEAVDHFTAAAQLAPDNAKRADAYYNLGNAQFKAEKIEEAIESYKESIQLNPNNDQARYNLLVAKNILKQQQQQQQQQEDQQQDQNQENQEQQEQDQQEQQQQQDQQNQDSSEEQNEEQKEQQDQEEQQDSTNQEQDISEGGAFDTTRLDKQTLDSLDAMKLLQIIENEEKKVQEKLKKFNSDRKKPDKDW